MKLDTDITDPDMEVPCKLKITNGKITMLDGSSSQDYLREFMARWDLRDGATITVTPRRNYVAFCKELLFFRKLIRDNQGLGWWRNFLRRTVPIYVAEWRSRPPRR